MSISLPSDQIIKSRIFPQYLIHNICSLWEISSFLGLVVCHPTDFKISPLHCRRISITQFQSYYLYWSISDRLESLLIFRLLDSRNLVSWILIPYLLTIFLFLDYLVPFIKGGLEFPSISFIGQLKKFFAIWNPDTFLIVYLWNN